MSSHDHSITPMVEEWKEIGYPSRCIQAWRGWVFSDWNFSIHPFGALSGIDYRAVIDPKEECVRCIRSVDDTHVSVQTLLESKTPLRIIQFYGGPFSRAVSPAGYLDNEWILRNWDTDDVVADYSLYRDGRNPIILANGTLLFVQSDDVWNVVMPKGAGNLRHDKGVPRTVRNSVIFDGMITTLSEGLSHCEHDSIKTIGLVFDHAGESPYVAFNDSDGGSTVFCLEPKPHLKMTLPFTVVSINGTVWLLKDEADYIVAHYDGRTGFDPQFDIEDTHCIFASRDYLFSKCGRYYRLDYSHRQRNLPKIHP